MIAQDSAYVQAATIIAADGDEDVLAAAFSEALASARAEPGVITYELSRSEDDPRRFFFYEVYLDRAAVKAHNQSEHVKRLAGLPETQRAQFNIVRYRRVSR